MRLTIEPGDILARTGLVGGYNVLSYLIGEPYNHSGLAINSFEVHHVESNGYETISIYDFFRCKNAEGGAVIRFTGPLANKIRTRVAEVASKRRYPKIPGNPFSTSNDSLTVNCNEFVFTLYQIAIMELLEESHDKDPATFAILSDFYSKRSLIKSNQIRVRVPGFYAGVVAAGAGLAGRAQVNSPDVQVRFEGTSPCTIGIPVLCIQSEMVLDTYTPNSFINSPFFKVVERVGCGQ